MKTRIPDTIKEVDLLKVVNDKELKDKPKRRLAYLLGFYNCLRVSEIIKLTPEDYTPNDKLLHIRQAKGSKDRNIPISPEVAKLIKHLPYGKGIRGLQKAFAKDSLRILGKAHHMHTLRHSGATYYLNEKKWDIRQLQVFLGHTNITMTQRYAHVNPEHLTKIMWEEGE